MSHINQIKNPLALAEGFLKRKGLQTDPAKDDLFDVAVESIIDAAISWNPEAGMTLISWCWLKMERDVYRELGRALRRRGEMERWDALETQGVWLMYDPGSDPYERLVERLDLRHWADLAELTPLMRFLVEFYALHSGAQIHDKPGGEVRGPLSANWPTLRLAFSHMRTAAVTGERRVDRWTNLRSKATNPMVQAGARKMESLRKTEADREALWAEHNAHQT
jgi:hypothetical protein